MLFHEIVLSKKITDSMPSKKVSLLSENNDSFLPEVRVI